MHRTKHPAVASVPRLPSADARERLSAMMQAYGDGIYGYCVRSLRDATLAADVLQQVFEQAYRDLASLRDESQARSWLFGIAYHRCLDALKSRRRTEARVVRNPEGLDTMPDSQPAPEERVAVNQMTLALEQCVEELSVESRTAVLLRFQESMTFEHMATVCQEKPATLQARVMRALPVLRRCLEGKGIEL